LFENLIIKKVAVTFFCRTFCIMRQQANFYSELKMIVGIVKAKNNYLIKIIKIKPETK